MSFNWSTYLDLAQELTAQASSSLYQDAKLRSATSRAYYAAFCKARNHLRDKDGLPVPRDGSAHRYVKENFKNHSIRERKKIGVNLERMKVNRAKADYDDVISDLAKIAEENLRLAEKVILSLHRL